MKLKLILYLFVFLFFLNCKKNTLPENDSKVSKSKIENNGFKSNKVLITGTTDDKVVFEYLNIVTETNLTLDNNQNHKKEIIDDSLNLVLNSIEKPLFAIVQASGSKSSFYRRWIFLIPGDTIRIKVKNGKMEFYGKNALFNNFYTDLDKNTPEYNKNPYQGSLMNYKNSVKSIYDKRNAFFQKFVQTNNIKSKLFLNTIETNLRHEYLHNLINPAYTKAKFLEGHYFNESDVLYSLLYKEQDENPEAIIDLKNYFEKVSIEEFKNQDAFHNSFFFRMNIDDYVRYYFLDSNYIPYSKEKFLAEKEFIQKNFDGEIENYAIVSLLRGYHLKGFGNSVNTIEIMKDLIHEYKDKYTKPHNIELMNDILEDLKSYKFELTDYALESKFININGDTLRLKDVFKRSNKRIKVLDFWASWCPPCIEQIKEGKDFKDRLSVKYNVEWIYISPEKDYEKWESANKKYKHTLNFYNSFFLLKGRSSALSKFFKIDQIPRYIIFDQKNTIILNNAPSPSDEEIFERIIDDIEK